MKNYLDTGLNSRKLISFFDELPLWSSPFGLKLLDYVDYKPGLSALDIGFGTGFPLTELAMRLGNSSLVYGIDPWKEAIIHAKKKISAYKIKNIKIIEGFAESIPLDNHSLHLIVSNNGLNNVRDLDQVLSECSRVMKPGGQFVQTMNLDKSMFEFYEQLERALSELQMSKEIELMHQHIYHKRRPLQEMIRMLAKHGFVIRDLEHDQFNYKFTDGTAMLNHHFIRLAFMESWKSFLPENKQEEIFDIIELRLNEQAKLLGEVRLSIPFVMINCIKKHS
jgi:arsenite methyltransferase